MSTSTTPRPRGSRKGHDAELLRERVDYWRSEGFTDRETHRELRDEGFRAGDIKAAMEEDARQAAARGDHRQNDQGDSDTKEPENAGDGSYVGFSGPEPKRSSLPDVAGTPAGLMLAIFAYPAVLAFLLGGPSGLHDWFQAKFFNKTPGSSSARTSAFTLLPETPSSAALPTAAAAPPTPSTGAGKGAQAAAWALSQLGKPYKWGGTGPGGFDCSGLTSQAWASVGVKIPRTTGGQIFTGTGVSKSELEPGDLVFPIQGHVQMYIGQGQIVEAPRTGVPVRVAKLGIVLRARRPGAKRSGVLV